LIPFLEESVKEEEEVDKDEEEEEESTERSQKERMSATPGQLDLTKSHRKVNTSAFISYSL